MVLKKSPDQRNQKFLNIELTLGFKGNYKSYIFYKFLMKILMAFYGYDLSFKVSGFR